MGSINFLEKWNIVSKNISTYGSKIDELLFLITIIVLPVTIVTFIILSFLILKGYINKKSRVTRVNYIAKVIIFLDLIVLILDLIIFNFTVIPWNEIQSSIKKDKSGDWIFPEGKIKKEDVLEIKVEAKQFSWAFYYPGEDHILLTEDDVYSEYAMDIPVDTKIILHIYSLDVIHSFWLPNLRFKQDAVPGREIIKWFEVSSDKANVSPEDWDKKIDIKSIKNISFKMQILREQMVDFRKNDRKKYIESQKKIKEMTRELNEIYSKSLMNKRLYEIICAEICGNSHYSMNAWLILHSKENFKKLLKKRNEINNKNLALSFLSSY